MLIFSCAILLTKRVSSCRRPLLITACIAEPGSRLLFVRDPVDAEVQQSRPRQSTVCMCKYIGLSV